MSDDFPVAAVSALRNPSNVSFLAGRNRSRSLQQHGSFADTCKPPMWGVAATQVFERVSWKSFRVFVSGVCPRLLVSIFRDELDDDKSKAVHRYSPNCSWAGLWSPPSIWCNLAWRSSGLNASRDKRIGVETPLSIASFFAQDTHSCEFLFFKFVGYPGLSVLKRLFRRVFFHVIARVRVLPPESMFPCLSVLWAIFGFAVNSIVRVFVSRACLCERIRWSSINKLKQRESSDCNMREERACGGTPQNISIFSCQWTLRLGRWSLVQ